MSKTKKDSLRYSEEDNRSLLEDILGFLKVFCITAIVVVIFVNFIAHPVNVVGRSMYPNLKDGDFGMTNKLSVITGNISRGDIVVITIEEDGQQTHWVKRIIGMPNETVSCKNDVIYINGEALDETSYIDPDYKQSLIDQFGYFNKIPNDTNTDVVDFDEVTLGSDEYFVMGDNRPYSKDSRYIGPIKKNQLYGKNMFVFYPFSEFGVKD